MNINAYLKSKLGMKKNLKKIVVKYTVASSRLLLSESVETEMLVDEFSEEVVRYIRKYISRERAPIVAKEAASCLVYLSNSLANNQIHSCLSENRNTLDHSVSKITKKILNNL